LGLGLDLSDFKQLEVERFGLGNDAEERRPIFETTGERGLAPLQLTRIAGKVDRAVGSEPALIRIVTDFGHEELDLGRGAQGSRWVWVEG